MIGYKQMKAFKLETDPTKFCLVLTVFYRIKKTCCAGLLNSQPSALLGTRVSMSVIANEESRYHQDLERAFYPCGPMCPTTQTPSVQSP